MFNACRKSLRTTMLVALASTLIGCGSGMERVVEAASQNSASVQASAAASTKNPVTADSMTASQVKMLGFGADALSTLTIGTVSLPTGQEGSTYASSLQVTGGSPSYTWSVKSGSLPAGMQLTSSGVLTGKPTATGTYSFVVLVQDSSKPAQQVTKSVVLTVYALPLQITSSLLNNARTGETYASSLTAVGGKAGYTWTYKGSLPKGLSLSSGGVLSGRPEAAGISTFLAYVSDSSSPVKTASSLVTLVTLPALLNVSTTSLNSGQVSSSYNATLSANGGTTPYKWSVSSGTLPVGLSLSSSGAITGTPTATGTSTFTVKMTDSGIPVQTATKSLSISVTAPPLAITTGAVASGQSNVTYATQLSAKGGTPAYTWSITSGSLPAGLTLGATTGVIQGTPSTSGSFPITYKVTDNGGPQQAASASATIAVSAAPVQSGATTWFIRVDGGTRYSSSNTTGQCDGKADAAYGGVGTNQHCAFNDVRWMWWNNQYGKMGWAMTGGDTLVIRGCAANAVQQNADNPHCRLGGDKATGSDSQDLWCIGVGSCVMPPPPSGSATQHTRILGGCAYDGNCNPVKSYPYTNNNLAQLYGGFNAPTLINMQGSKYVDLAGLELTTHNGQCARYGTTNPLPGCNRGSTYPLSDQADQAIATSNTSANILLQDLYIHGFSSSGIVGPIGGAFKVERVNISFNAFAGWNFDDGVPTANAAGSSITQSYVTLVGNGCQEEYPITHTQFPAKGCWDSSTGGFGDAWSGQESALDSFTCDHCYVAYNTKDAAMGPHTQIASISLTNSLWYGNMGQAGKWGQRENATFLFQNNIVVGNCLRMSQSISGAAQNFDQSTGRTGAGLNGYCRAAGAMFAYFSGANSTVNFNNNTIITYQPTVFQMSCYSSNTCGTSPYRFTNNLILGYTSTYNGSPFNPGQAPGLYYQDDATIAILGSHNLEYGIRNGDGCGNNSTTCSNPMLVNQPSSFGTTESVLDALNYHPNSGSPAVSYGASYSGSPLTDYYGQSQTPTLTVGAVVP